jgi:hypothetical protein
MRKIIVTFALVILIAPLVVLAEDTTQDLTQLNIDIYRMKEQIGQVQQTLVNVNKSISTLVELDNLKLAQHITDETDPMKQSQVVVIVIGLLVSTYFFFRGMNLIYSKTRNLKKPREDEKQWH